MKITIILLLALTAFPIWADSDRRTVAEVTYLGNEGLLVVGGISKVLFDPFFHSGYNNYQLVPEEIRSALFSGEPPYDGIDAIFISHAHGDHFAADDLLQYLKQFPDSKLVASDQAIAQIVRLAGSDSVLSRMISISLAYQDPPVSQKLGNINFDVVRIPHAGWPQRADVSNLVFRVTLQDKTTVVHMGDADPDDAHFKPLMQHWQRTRSDAAFPPYWFFFARSGQLILSNRIAAPINVGVHVPIKVPQQLKVTGQQYFSRPGEKLTLSAAKPD